MQHEEQSEKRRNTQVKTTATCHFKVLILLIFVRCIYSQLPCSFLVLLNSFSGALFILHSCANSMIISRMLPSCNICRPPRQIKIQRFVVPSVLPKPKSSSQTSALSSDASNSHKNPDFRPRRIILLRHGQSKGNVDESAYVTTADWRIPLTDVGKAQAKGERDVEIELCWIQW